MGIILDVIVIAIFALNIFICYKKGLVRLAVGLIAVLTAIVLSIIPVSYTHLTLPTNREV